MQATTGTRYNVKKFLIAMAILLVAAFSTVEGRVEFTYPFGNWAVPGAAGDPVPGEGEPGDVNTFSFGKADRQTAAPAQGEQAAQEYSPITVTVEQQEKVRKWGNMENINRVLYGIASTLIVELIALLVTAAVLDIKHLKRRKRKNAF